VSITNPVGNLSTNYSKRQIKKAGCDCGSQQAIKAIIGDSQIRIVL
jgi:hypothetical protein